MDLPLFYDEGHLVLQSKALLGTWEGQLRNKVIEEYLVQWRNLSDKDATWEGYNILQHP